MSLQVWLPLNGSLKNQGARGDVTFTSVGSWTYESGKVTSSCMTIPYIPPQGTYDSNITADSKFKFTKNFSVSIWAKLPTDNGHLNPYIASEGTYDTNVKKLGWFIRVKGTSIIISVSSSYHEYTELVSGNWYLITFTINDNCLCSIYINGIFKESFSLEQVPEYGENARLIIGFLGFSSAGSLMAWNGSVNDFRLYDHCLSVKEVKELAKGLMLHYTLSRPQDNLLVNTSNYLNATQSKPNKDGYASYPMYANNLSDGDYIYSIKVTKGTLSSGHTTGGVDYTKGYWTLWTYTSATPYSNSDYSHYTQAVCYTSGNLLGRIGDVYYWKITISSSYPNLAVRINTYSDGTNNATIDFGQLKLEKYSTGVNKPTPWIPNSADTLYSAMGLNSTTESDVTGYGNNSTRVNITTRESDTPRYLSSMIFNGSNSYIYLPKNSGRPTDAITVSIWAYMSDWSTFAGRLISCTEGGGWNFEPSSSKMHFAMGTGTSSNTYKSVYSTKTLVELGSGWHHFVGTYNGLQTKIYIDGVLEGTLDAYSTATPIYYANNYTFVGAEAGGNTTTPYGNYFNGKLSDCRIYATALSADDILELYHTSASIDKNGNMHCYELLEV